ncbi:hypothetical protein ACWGGS_19350 [Streptomyces decoyicus]
MQLVTDQGDCEIAEYNQALTYAGSPSAEILRVTGSPQGLRWCVLPDAMVDTARSRSCGAWTKDVERNTRSEGQMTAEGHVLKA